MTDSTVTTLDKLDPAGRALLFTQARTANSFADTPVTDAELADIWELTRWTPTSANVQPLRVVYVRSEEGKQRLLPHMAEGNRAKTEQAPVNAILAWDSDFHENIPTVFPINPGMKDALDADRAAHAKVGRSSAWLTFGAFILAVRAAGLAAGPMTGLDTEGVDKEFFVDGRWKTLAVVNIGHPGENPWFDRLPRLEHDDTVVYA